MWPKSKYSPLKYDKANKMLINLNLNQLIKINVTHNQK